MDLKLVVERVKLMVHKLAIWRGYLLDGASDVLLVLQKACWLDPKLVLEMVLAKVNLWVELLVDVKENQLA